MLRERSRPTLLGIGIIVLSVALVTTGVTAPASATTSIATAVARILADTNALRVANGKPPLLENTGIDAVSQGWANQLAAPGQTFAHNPNFFSQMPAGATSGGENIARGFTYDTVVSQGWAKSAGHLANMLGNWTDIGIGYYESADGSTTFLVQNFGYYPAHAGQVASTTPPPATSSPVTSQPSASPSPTASPTSLPTPSPSPSASVPGQPVPSSALVSLSSLPAPVASTATAPIPKVVGNRIVNTRTNATWTAHAVNWPSFEYACQQGWAYAQSGRTAAAAQAMVSWGITAVRIPLNEDCWLGTDGSPRYGTAAGYQTALRQFVDILNSAGLVVILDLHWSGGTGVDSDGQRAMADDQSPLFWEQVSYAYSKVPSVMFDAFNEPYSRGSAALSWSCWANGGCTMPNVNDESSLNGSTFAVVGMKDIVSAIRGTGATQPILLAGLDYANDLRGWLANRPSDSQLVASWHNYPGQRCQTVTCWNTEVAPVAAQVPVIATEFGETDGGTSFLTTFMNWADNAGIGYAPWAWWWTDASDGAEANAYALIQNGTFTPKAPQGTTYHDHLAAIQAPPFAISPWFLGLWRAQGGAAGRLGDPTAGPACVPATCYQSFQGGIVTGSPTGTMALYGAYRDAWIAAGGPSGSLGLPLRGEVCNGSDCWQAFQGGVVDWSPGRNAVAVPAWFASPWQAQAGGLGRLGVPTAAMICVPETCYQSFTGGAMSGSTSGVLPVFGAYRDLWFAAGGPAGRLGLPARPESCNGHDCSMAFQGGIVDWTADTGAVIVTSWFLAPWTNQGAGLGRLGSPRAAMVCVPATCYQRFTGGMLSGSTSGEILPIYSGYSDAWLAAGGPAGPMGLPLRRESCDGLSCSVAFEHGIVTWSPSTGTFAVQEPIYSAWAASGGTVGRYGLPVAAATTSNGVVSQRFEHGTLAATS